MRSRIIRSGLAASLSALLSMPAFAADMAPSGGPTATLLPDELDVPMQLLALLGPAVAISVLTILGLTITFRALRHDRRERRILYRPRRHRAQGRDL
jgi:hypothetical protein